MIGYGLSDILSKCSGVGMDELFVVEVSVLRSLAKVRKLIELLSELGVDLGVSYADFSVLDAVNLIVFGPSYASKWNVPLKRVVEGAYSLMTNVKSLNGPWKLVLSSKELEYALLALLEEAAHLSAKIGHLTSIKHFRKAALLDGVDRVEKCFACGSEVKLVFTDSDSVRSLEYYICPGCRLRYLRVCGRDKSSVFVVKVRRASRAAP